jgi:tetratricopeptide (TPR) repeat protein
MMLPPTSRARRVRWIVLGIAGLLLVGSAIAARRWFHPALVDPPMPADIQDTEVRQAIEQARQKVVNAPRSAQAWGGLGLTLLAHLFNREADTCFVQAAILDPTDARWPYARGLIAQKLHAENALPLLRRAVALAAQSWSEHRAELSLQLAEALLEQQQGQECEQVYREEWRRRPGDPRAALGLGRIALARGDYESAADFLTAARASRYAAKMATGQLAALARSRGDRAAVAAYEKEYAALPNDPPWPDPILDLLVGLQVGRRARERQAAELEKENRYAEAAELWLRELEQRRTSRACIGAGINLARLREYDRALPLLRDGVRLAPDNAHAHYSLALALFTRAEKEWQHAPFSASAKEGFRETIPHARRATELKPDHAMAYLFWGLSLKYLGDPAAAIAPLRLGTACRPELIELQLALGEALLESGQCSEATNYLQNARRLDPNDPRPSAALKRLRVPEPRP